MDIMKKIFAVIAVVFCLVTVQTVVCCRAFAQAGNDGEIAVASPKDMPLGFHSVGIDTYSDGVTPVIDGECYALVWTRDGFDFAGFLANGSLIDAKNNDIVHVRSLAKDGKCPPVNFVVSERYRTEHPGGTYRVVVLDTRTTASALAGLDAAAGLKRVNGWGWAKVRRDYVADVIRTFAAAPSALSGARIDTAARMPADSRPPRIMSFAFDAVGNALIGFKGESYLSYRVAEGKTIASVGETKGSDLAPGSGEDETPAQLMVPKQELETGAAFFRVEAKDWMCGE